ncbi:MAG: helix-turn-helix domain-containing protein [Adlercreutzia equolifaciens]
MSQLEDLNRAMAYIEEHLDGTVDMDVLARIAVCSKYQLQRMFPYLTGVTLPEYIRRRAMTRAAQDLRATDAKVVDVALRYGYDSPTAFARAFRRVHGASPNDARRPQTKLTLYPRFVFTLSVKGEEPMDYRIIEQGAFRVVGIPSDNGTWEVEDAGERLPITGEVGIPRARDSRSVDGSSRLGCSAFSSAATARSTATWPASRRTARAPRHGERIVEAATYAVFECVGPCKGMPNLWHRILTEWLLSSGYRWEATDVERHYAAQPPPTAARSGSWW